MNYFKGNYLEDTVTFLSQGLQYLYHIAGVRKYLLHIHETVDAEAKRGGQSPQNEYRYLSLVLQSSHFSPSSSIQDFPPSEPQGPPSPQLWEEAFWAREDNCSVSVICGVQYACPGRPQFQILLHTLRLYLDAGA